MGHGSRMVHGLGLCTLFYVDAPEDVHYSGQTDQHTPSDASLPVSHSGTIMSTEKSTLAKDSSGSLSPTPDAHISKSKSCFCQKFQISSSQWGVLGCMCWFAMICFFILGVRCCRAWIPLITDRCGKRGEIVYWYDYLVKIHSIKT